MKKSILLTAFVIGMAVLFAGTSSVRADIVTKWDVSISSEFSNISTYQYKTGSNKGITFNDLSDGVEMRWTDSTDRYSSATLTNLDGVLETDGTATDVLKFTHRNKVVSYSTLFPELMDVNIYITLSPAGSGPDALSVTVPLTLSLQFLETPNSETKAQYGVDDDIFVVTNMSDLQQFFVYEDVWYDVTLETTLQALTGTRYEIARDMLGLDTSPTLYGWGTLEGKISENAIDIGLQVRHNTMTPEPASWLIFGIGGLIAPAALRARKKRSERGV